VDIPIRHVKGSSLAIGALLAWLVTAVPALALDGPLSFERGRRDLPKVALTFDGGSDEGDSAQILAILEEKSVRATFFLTGGYIAKYPRLVQRMVAAGHEVGNHTRTHPHLTSWDRNSRHDTLPGVDRDFLVRELDATARAFARLTGGEMTPFWRAPYGEVNAALLSWAAERGYRHVSWTRDDRGRVNLDSLDWVSDRRSRLYLDSAGIRDRLLGFERGSEGLNGGIVLMHLCTRRSDPGVTRLAELIDTLRDRGYRLVPVTELLLDLDREQPATLRTAAIHLP
jgi:peptidoglycan/xylan/chitin deacetylase (PgdA/CDA1 family)